MSRLFPFYISFVVIAFICVWSHLWWPIYGEEADYVRFAIWPTNAGAWFRDVFWLADGHPPLLSLVLSSILKNTSPLGARLCAFVLSTCGMYFLFVWNKSLKLPVWSTLMSALFLFFLPVHQEIYTSMFSDFHGFTLLMGWAYFRYVKRLTAAMICLLGACLLRETHVIPAILFISLGWKDQSVRKSIWVELASILALALYYSAAKIRTGYWYPFDGTNHINFEKLLSLNWLYSTLPILLPLFIVLSFELIQNTKLEKPIFFKKRFLISLALILILVLGPYLATFHKARILTPYISFYWLAILHSWNVLRLDHKIKAVVLVGILVFSYALHIKTNKELVKKEEKIEVSREIVSFAIRLKLPEDSIVLGDWPHSLNLTFPELGFIQNEHFKLNRYYFPNLQNSIATKHPQAPLVYISTGIQKAFPLALNEICQLGCDKIEIHSPANIIWTIYYRNVSPDILLNARGSFSPHLNPKT